MNRTKMRLPEAYEIAMARHPKSFNELGICLADALEVRTCTGSTFVRRIIELIGRGTVRYSRNNANANYEIGAAIACKFLGKTHPWETESGLPRDARLGSISMVVRSCFSESTRVD